MLRQAWAVLRAWWLGGVLVRGRAAAGAVSTLALGGAPWHASSSNGSLRFATPVPGFALETLVADGRAGDPWVGTSEFADRWTSFTTWVYERQFQAGASLLGHNRVDLMLEGVDTVADAQLNGQPLGVLDNAHRRWRLPVKELLRPGTNNLSLTFRSAFAEANRLAAAAPYPLPSNLDNFPPQPVAHSTKYNELRKPASDFGWDWGPALGAAGIYGLVQLEGYSTPHITGVYVQQQHSSGGAVALRVTAFLQGGSSDARGVLSVACVERPEWRATAPVTVPGNATGAPATLQVAVTGPYELWWPNGYGNQTLYGFTVRYSPHEGDPRAQAPGPAPSPDEAAAAAGDSTFRLRVGLRTIQLVQDALPQVKGETFYFSVNGLPIFMKGANIIPTSLFHDRDTPQRYEQLLRDTTAVHMNMIRVWGGGRYPPDEFYDLCDELGLLVWQEAAFACAPYPSSNAFLANVEAEVTDLVRRVGRHPSIAIWGGNNEVEQSFEWYPQTRANTPLYQREYLRLFVGTIRRALLAVDPALIYVDSSPSNGVHSLDPYTKRKPSRWGWTNNPALGDIHFYNYAANCLDPQTYPPAKFVSEYGFQSWPSWPLYSRVTAPEDWARDSNMSAFRQRHPDGQAELLAQLHRHFRVPAARAASAADQARLFRHYLYLTQVQQARCYAAAVSTWRRLRQEPTARTMGVLYWQLNDVWPGASWSGIDADGRWRLLHHEARRFYAPLLLAAELDAERGEVTAHVVSDLPRPLAGTVAVQVYAWNTTAAPDAARVTEWQLEPLGGAQVLHVPYADLLGAARLQHADPRDVFLKLTARPAADADAPASEAYIFPVPNRDAHVPLQPGVHFTDFEATGDSTAAFTVRARATALWVALESEPGPAGTFSDSNFVLTPDAPRRIAFAARAPFRLADLRGNLSATSLADTLAGPLAPPAPPRDDGYSNLAFWAARRQRAAQATAAAAAATAAAQQAEHRRRALLGGLLGGIGGALALSALGFAALCLLRQRGRRRAAAGLK